MSEADGGRVPPNDEGAETSVLGAMLLSADAIASVCETLRAEDFYQPSNGLVFDTAVDLYGRGQAVDAVTVAADLAKTGSLARIGGAGYLHTLAASVPTTANVTFYADIVAEKALLRRLASASTRISQSAYQGLGDADRIVDAAQEEIYAVSRISAGHDYRRLDVALVDALNGIEALAASDGAMSGVSTGFPDLDRLTSGLQPGQMIVIAGRPAMGKSTFALDLARAAAIGANSPAAVFSLEMSEPELVQRILAAEARVPLGHLRTGAISEPEWVRLAETMPRISSAPLFIDDSANMTMMEIRSKCRRLKQRDGLRLVIIDYLQLLTSAKRAENRQQEVSEFSRSVKLLAKELDVPVVALSQLNRGPEMRQDKRPMLADLRESGAIEQDADVVMMLHREDVYDPDSPRAGEADIIVVKQRNGPVGTIAAAFQGTYSRLVPLAGDVEAPPAPLPL